MYYGPGMATKAQQFRAEQQRSNRPPKAKKPKRPRRDVPTNTALPGVSATDRKAGGAGTANRNASNRKKGGPALEDSATGKPSRKSTRKSLGRVKLATNLTRRQTRKVSSPQARAARGKVR
jgi:hypothetical protein